MIAGLLAKPSVAATIGFLRAIPRQVWYALAAAGLLWAAYAWVYGRGADSRQAEVDQLLGKIVAADNANAANLATITQLQAANKAWANAAAEKDKKAAEAVEQVARERDALAAELNRRRNYRESIYERDQDAAAWSRQRVPAALVEQLRE